MVTPDPAVKVPLIHDMVFTQEWLDAKDEEDEQGRTNRETMTIVCSELDSRFLSTQSVFVTLQDYLRRIEITKPQTLLGSLSQMAAGLGHYVKGDRLRTISASIPKVMIITGDNDALVPPENSFILKRNMPEAEIEQWEKCAHAIHVQYRRRFNTLLERVFREGKEKLDASPGTW